MGFRNCLYFFETPELTSSTVTGKGKMNDGQTITLQNQLVFHLVCNGSLQNASYNRQQTIEHRGRGGLDQILSNGLEIIY